MYKFVIVVAFQMKMFYIISEDTLIWMIKRYTRGTIITNTK